jgi:hypothetical protein
MVDPLIEKEIAERKRELQEGTRKGIGPFSRQSERLRWKIKIFSQEVGRILRLG